MNKTTLPANTSEIADLLGLPASPDGLPEACPASSVRVLIEAVGDRDLVARALPATVMRRRAGELDRADSERVYRIAAIWLMCHRVFGDDDTARRWLGKPHVMLSGSVPIECAAASAAGLEDAEGVLGRLYYGSAV